MPDASQIASPCVGTCRVNPIHGLCIGCARTLDEIASWRGASSAARDRVWAELPARRARFGLVPVRPEVELLGDSDLSVGARSGPMDRDSSDDPERKIR